MEPNIIFDANNITIINNDICDIALKTIIPPIDLIITSPPYNAGMPYEQKLTIQDYTTFALKTSIRIYRWLKPDGRFCINVPFCIKHKTENGTQSSYPYLIWIEELHRAGLQIKDNIIWNQKDHSCNTAWGSFASASAPHIRYTTEMIIVGYKETWQKTIQGKSNIAHEEFTQWTEDMWEIPVETNRNHPAPYPEELSTRCIKLFSYVGDTILDPFMGSGTTLISAFKNKRKAIGVDISRVYCDYAVNRLKMTGINAEANFKRYFK
jgi:site-specific DNA-methyltransferase (adenine-specific)